MKVRTVYAPGVFEASPAEDLGVAASRMEFNAVGALVVRDGGHVIGILSERDVLRAVAEGRSLEGTPIGEFMTEEPMSVGPETELAEAAATMVVLGVRHLPVRDGGDVVGMLSARDLLGVEAFSELAAAIEG